jgi:hypothetical protein
MIASFSNDFIFLKTQKTGGTSVGLVLSTWCTSIDILSPLYPPDELLRTKMGAPLSTSSYNGVRIHSHMSGREIRSTFPELWDKAYKISVERHPYEKAVSRAFWEIGLVGGDPKRDFADALNRSVEDNRLSNRDIYCIDGKVIADQIIDQRNIDAELKQLATRFGKKIPVAVPRAKSQFRVDHRPAREILNNNQKQRIVECCSFEFEHFGFEL